MAETAIIDANNPANGMKVNSDGSINANTTVTPPANQRVSSLANDFATGSIVDLLTLLTTIQAIISGGKLLNTETNSASIKTDLDTLLTDMTELLGDTDNLATLAGIVSGGKGAVKAGAGDFADGADATQGAKGDPAATDGSSSWSVIALLKGILTKLLGSIAVTGTITANTGTPMVGTPTEAAVTVGVTSGTALAANTNAKYRQFINDSPNTIYLSFSGANAALNTGTRLNANGGSILFDRYVPTGIVKAIATAASSNLLVTEG